MSLRSASAQLPRHIKASLLPASRLTSRGTTPSSPSHVTLDHTAASTTATTRSFHGPTASRASQFGSPNPSATNPGASPMNQQPKGQSAETQASTSTSPSARSGAADQQQQPGGGDGMGQSADAVNSLGGHREGRTHEEKAPNPALNAPSGATRVLAFGAAGLAGAYLIFGRGEKVKEKVAEGEKKLEKLV